MSKYDDMDVSKWFIMENPIKIHDLGGFPPIFGKHPYGDELNESLLQPLLRKSRDVKLSVPQNDCEFNQRDLLFPLKVPFD